MSSATPSKETSITVEDDVETSPGTATPPASAGFADLLTDFRQRIDRQLEAFLARKRKAAEGSVAQLADSLGVLIGGGGKRLRPALVHFTHRALGGGDEAAALPVALSTEILHAYLLVHDDIMDHSDLRRGEPTTHVQFRRLHEREGWPGDAADFGRSVAILVGDLAHSWAVELFQEGLRRAGAGVDREALDLCFAAMSEEVIGGQFLEMRMPYRARKERPGEGELVTALQLKSGRYSVERPIELGALLAGAAEDARGALQRYGRAAGEAFQLQDDILGTFGEEEATGKPAASDLEEGKHTLLVHFALEGASEADGERLWSLLGRDLAEGEVAEARSILERSGGLARVRRRIARRLAEAREALDEVEMTDEGRSFFEGMLDYLAEREA